MIVRIAAEQLRVYVIVDPRHFDIEAGKLADRLYSAGVSAIQLRAKGAEDDQVRAWGADFAVSSMKHDGLFIVNDRVDLAVEIGADGVHLGPGDTTVAEARKVAPDLVIGGSAGTVERALELQGEGADYLGCGAIWEASPSKADASNPRGISMIREVSSAVDVPVVGIGGITIERAPEVLDAGAAGVAVIRAIADHDDPAAAAARLVAATSG